MGDICKDHEDKEEQPKPAPKPWEVNPNEYEVVNVAGFEMYVKKTETKSKSDLIDLLEKALDIARNMS